MDFHLEPSFSADPLEYHIPFFAYHVVGSWKAQFVVHWLPFHRGYNHSSIVPNSSPLTTGKSHSIPDMAPFFWLKNPRYIPVYPMIFPFWRYVRPTETKKTHHQISIPLCPYSILLYPYHIPIISHCIRSPQQCGLNTFRKKPLSVATLFGEL